MNIAEVLKKLEGMEGGSEMSKVIGETLQAAEEKAQATKALLDASERTNALVGMASKTKADIDVLARLLPSDIKINADGTLDKNGKSISLQDYIKEDAILVKFSSSIFPTEATAPVVKEAPVIAKPVVLPNGRGDSKPTATVVSTVLSDHSKTYDQAVNDQLKLRFAAK